MACRPSSLCVTVSVLALCFTTACDDVAEADVGAGGRGVGGAGSGAGGGSGGGALSTTDFLAPSSYDCTGPSAPEPAARPYVFGCIHDAACTSRFIAAHRMGTIFAPENSLSALRASILIGADIAETDVRVTQDGRVVLVHDSDVDRTLEGTGDVKDFTLAEIQAMAMDLKSTDPAGADFSCERVPTIEEALAVADGKIVIEFETKETEAGILTAQYLAASGLYGSAYVQCSPDECDAIRAVVPDVPIMVRVTDVAELDRVEGYDPPPILVEIDAVQEFLAPAVQDRIRGVGAKVFTNVFTTADVAALLTGDLSLYPDIFDQGPDVLQTEFPHLALYGIGRATPLP